MASTMSVKICGINLGESKGEISEYINFLMQDLDVGNPAVWTVQFKPKIKKFLGTNYKSTIDVSKASNWMVKNDPEVQQVDVIDVQIGAVTRTWWIDWSWSNLVDFSAYDIENVKNALLTSPNILAIYDDLSKDAGNMLYNEGIIVKRTGSENGDLPHEEDENGEDENGEPQVTEENDLMAWLKENQTLILIGGAALILIIFLLKK
ncbi:MAG: hypothetical protein ACOC80_14210 [Petrotogales bacterium]